MQPCRLCGCIKPFAEFTVRKESGKHRTECKPCRSNASAAGRYGVTVGEVEKLKEQQGNACAICKTKADDIPHTSFCHNPLVIDHDHETGSIRGLLCPTCNSMLGHAHDDVDVLLAAIQYLRGDR